MSRQAVVLVSGGLDSATVLAIARAEGYACHAITFDYGQRHRVELEASRRVSEALGAVSHRTIVLDTAAFRGSALTDGGDVPKARAMDEIADGIPVTYVPARNLVFLSYAVGVAEGLGAEHLFIGVNAVDYSGYPDCRPEFIRSFGETANLATKVGVEGGGLMVHAPLQDLSKRDIIRRGLELGVDYGLTISCYDPDGDGIPCGDCDACRLRAHGFAEAGAEDPVTRRCS